MNRNTFFDDLVQSKGYRSFSRKMMAYSLIAVACGVALWIFQGRFSNPATVCGFGCLSVMFFLKSFEKPRWDYRLLWWGIVVLTIAALFLGAHWAGGRQMAYLGAALVVSGALAIVRKQNQ